MTTSRQGDRALRWLGHASTVLDLGGTRVLTDPLLRAHAGLLRRRGSAPAREHWQDPAVVLVSHLHLDHAEVPSLRLVRDAPVLSGGGNAHWLRAAGLDAPTLHEGTWWQVPAADGASPVRVRLVRAAHGHRPMPHRPNAAHGFLLEHDGYRVWFAGDTAPYPEMVDLPELAGGPLDLVLIPVGGWGPRLSGGHMDPVEAARVCGRVGARTAVPVHWGTLHAPAGHLLPPGWMDRGGPAFAAALHREAPGCRPLVLAPGEQVTLGEPVTPGDQVERG